MTVEICETTQLHSNLNSLRNSYLSRLNKLILSNSHTFLWRHLISLGESSIHLLQWECMEQFFSLSWTLTAWMLGFWMVNGESFWVRDFYIICIYVYTTYTITWELGARSHCGFWWKSLKTNYNPWLIFLGEIAWSFQLFITYTVNKTHFLIFHVSS